MDAVDNCQSRGGPLFIPALKIAPFTLAKPARTAAGRNLARTSGRSAAGKCGALGARR